MNHRCVITETNRSFLPRLGCHNLDWCLGLVRWCSNWVKWRCLWTLTCPPQLGCSPSMMLFTTRQRWITSTSEHKLSSTARSVRGVVYIFVTGRIKIHSFIHSIHWEREGDRRGGGWQGGEPIRLDRSNAPLACVFALNIRFRAAVHRRCVK